MIRAAPRVKRKTLSDANGAVQKKLKIDEESFYKGSSSIFNWNIFILLVYL